ncbi:MAG: hypothetical protein WBY71_02620 [Nitrososphaeraceae archaeon]
MKIKAVIDHLKNDIGAASVVSAMLALLKKNSTAYYNLVSFKVFYGSIIER